MNVNYSRYWQIALKSLLNNQYLSYEEIAQELGVSEKTIKYQLSYLRIS
jgi:biotin operon repressor